jgi:hypothetical protein
VSPCGPYAKARVADDPLDVFYYRNTLGQGPFMLRAEQGWYPLHLLAQNLPVPSVVLENPSPAALRAELRRGGWDVVAIAFTVTVADRVLEMVRWIRELAPGAEVILGGYGTAVFRTSEPLALELRALVDAICPGEGLAFMRAWLAERWSIPPPAPGPVRQALEPIRQSLFRTRLTLFRQAVVVGALGCPYGCGFCATSAQFERRRVELATGPELVARLEEQRRLHPAIDSALVYDEDFLLDRPRFLAFLEAVERSEALRRRPFALTVFAALRSLRACTVEELLRAGVGTVYLGVESLEGSVLGREGLEKRSGELEAWFERLHRHGIHTLGSLVVGWDGQDLARTRADVDRFAALDPTFYQVIPLHPVPGTALWSRLEREGRLDRSRGFGGDQVGRFTFRLSDLSREEALAEVARSARALVDRGGPWPARLAEDLVRGIPTLEAHADERVRARAAGLRRTLRATLPLAVAARVFFRGRGFRARWRATVAAAWRLERGALLASVALAPLTCAVLAAVYAVAQARYWLLPGGDPPARRRTRYPGVAAPDAGAVSGPGDRCARRGA